MIVFDLQVDRWKQQQEKKHLPLVSAILCKCRSLAPLGLCLSFSIIVYDDIQYATSLSWFISFVFPDYRERIFSHEVTLFLGKSLDTAVQYRQVVWFFFFFWRMESFDCNQGMFNIIHLGMSIHHQRLSNAQWKKY
jgi:hypothetical protein